MRRASRARDERGAAAVELALLATVMLAGIIIVVVVGQFINAGNDVSDAAYAAARAASYTNDAASAQAAGTSAAQQAMTNRGNSCSSMTTSVDTSDFVPGGNIRVTVTCVATVATITGFGFIPGHKSFTSTAVVPIDPHRVM